jgi:hypothetical protein
MKTKPSNHDLEIVNLFLEGNSIKWIVDKETSKRSEIEEIIRNAFIATEEEIIEERNYISRNY